MSRPEAPPLSWKGGLALLAGWPLCRLPAFAGLKARLLATWVAPQSRSRLDGLLFKAVFAYWWRREYLAERDPDRREAMKSALMGGSAGAVWASYYDAAPVDLAVTIGHMPYVEAVPLLPDLDKLLAAAEPTAVVQIGASSGREVAWLAARHPRHAFVGTDVFPEVVAYAAAHHRLPNLSFETAAADAVAAVVGRFPGRPAVLFSSGSLQYVQPEHIQRMLESLADRPATRLLLLEPGTELWGPADDVARSVYAGNLSYMHGYRSLAERSGWETVESRVIRPYAPYTAFPQHLHTVHCYFHGITKPPR